MTQMTIDSTEALLSENQIAYDSKQPEKESLEARISQLNAEKEIAQNKPESADQ